jgi:hypothetical protein
VAEVITLKHQRAEAKEKKREAAVQLSVRRGHLVGRLTEIYEAMSEHLPALAKSTNLVR